MINIAYTVSDVRRALHGVRAAHNRIAFVPTMGNLHAGHLALVRRARGVSDYTLVSSFVNPYQFGQNEDFDSYPRTPEDDMSKLRAEGVDLLFAPQAREIYPRGPDHITTIEVPELGRMLCGVSRPTFFRGVTTVVGILFNIVQPDVALFGEKDFQQLVVIRRMTSDLHLPVEILPVPTVRESDGLAMSSRNAYLSKEERRVAPVLYQTLCATRDVLGRGERNFRMLEREGMQALEAMGLRTEYFAVRRAGDLALPDATATDLRILAAAWLGRARLIDNVGSAST
jgi:pantoate--beta-alanine ligase